MLTSKSRRLLLIDVAHPGRRLVGQRWRGQPVWRGEIEKLQHVVRRGITRSQRRHVEPDLNQSQDRGQIAPGMRNIVGPDPWRNNGNRQAKTSLGKGARLISG